MDFSIESIAAALGIVWAGFERFRSMRANQKTNEANQKATVATAERVANEEVIKAKDRVIDTVREETLAWQARYETEHKEFVESRQLHHDRMQEINAKLLSLAETNTELQAKTDLTPLVGFAESQLETNAKIVSCQESIVDTQHKILGVLKEINANIKNGSK